MSQVQPWIAVGSVLLGIGMGAAAASWHWARRLNMAQRFTEQLHASRNLLDQQNTQARRQVEQLQVEMAELRIVADRARRKLAQLMPEPAVGTAAPSAPPKPTAQEVAQMLNQNDQRRTAGAAAVAAGDDHDDNGFEPTQVDPPDQL